MKPILASLILVSLGCDNSEEINALRKEQEKSTKRLEEIQRNDRIEREGQAQRNMESYLR